MYKRVFKLWYYTVSHNQMLLRSLGDTNVCNLDIYFADVIYIELPTKIDELKIIETSQEDIDYISQKIGNTTKTITVLKNEQHKFYVVSSVVKKIENNATVY